MKHAGPATFARIPRLLEELRRRPQLTERRPGTFYLKSKAFLHFHDDASGVFADAKLDGVEFTRLPVTTRAEQRTLLRQIDHCLRASSNSR